MDPGIHLDCEIRPVIKFSYLQLRQLTKNKVYLLSGDAMPGDGPPQGQQEGVRFEAFQQMHLGGTKSCGVTYLFTNKALYN